MVKTSFSYHRTARPTAVVLARVRLLVRLAGPSARQALHRHARYVLVCSRHKLALLALLAEHRPGLRVVVKILWRLPWSAVGVVAAVLGLATQTRRAALVLANKVVFLSFRVVLSVRAKHRPGLRYGCRNMHFPRLAAPAVEVVEQVLVNVGPMVA